MDAHVIEMQGVWLVFGTNEKPIVAIADVDVSIPRSRFVVIVGPSGCGKSSLLRMMGGLTTPTAGKVIVHSNSSNSRLAPTGMVFQEPSVFPWLNVTDNITYGLKAHGYSNHECRRIAEKYLAAMRLPEHVRNFYPYQLSGGMRQRVAIARAFATRSSVLLMDEPFSALDEITKLSLQQELIKVWEEDRTTVVFITHSVDEAIALGDEIIVMGTNPGRILSRFTVPFGRPREILKLRKMPAYADLAEEIWKLLQTNSPSTPYA